MGAGIEVDLDALRHGAEQLQQVAERLQEEWSAFSAQVQGMGDIFGDDDVGGLIGASYLAAHDIADQSFTSVVEAFGGFAAGLAQSAAVHEANEHETAGTFLRMLR